MCALLGKVTIKYEIYPICQKECADIRQKKNRNKKRSRVIRHSFFSL